MSNINTLKKRGKSWWTLAEIASALGLSIAAARVFCSRASARNDLIRVKRERYVLSGWIAKADEAERFRFANILVSPSYISLLTALSFYGVTSQMVASACESICETKSKRYSLEGFEFHFIRFPSKYRFGFVRTKGFFIAEPEKALADTIYLTSFGKYALDVEAVDLKKLDIKKVQRYLKAFPKRTQKYFQERFGI